MKHVYSTLIGLIIGLGSLFILNESKYSVVYPGNSVPLYKYEYKELTESLYRYYNTHNIIPIDEIWMTAKDRETIVNSGGAITWDAKGKVLSYRYDKEYPVNLGFYHILTFGLVDSGPSCIGESLNEDAIINNAKLRNR